MSYVAKRYLWFFAIFLLLIAFIQVVKVFTDGLTVCVDGQCHSLRIGNAK